MEKTNEELQELKEQIFEINEILKELSDEELQQVVEEFPVWKI